MANVPISQFFDTPPDILTSLEALPANPYSGPLQFVDRVRGPVGLDAFGIQWQVTLAPAGIGSTIYTQINYDRVVMELREVKSDIGGTLVFGRTLDVSEAEGRMFFSTFPLTRLALWVYPGVEVQLHWILVL